MVLGLRYFTNIHHPTGQPILDSQNGEEYMHIEPHVAVVLANHSPQSPGTLFVTSKQVIWLSDVDKGKSYAVDFVSVSLHAVSRDQEAYPSPCIYTQIETEPEEDDSDGSDSECGETIDLSKITEMRLVPSDPSHLDTLFEIFCTSASQNPDPAEEEENEEHNWILSADGMEAQDTEGEESEWHISQNSSNSIGHSNGDHDLASTVLQLQINDQRFEDAEEMEHGRGSSNQ